MYTVRTKAKNKVKGQEVQKLYLRQTNGLTDTTEFIT